ncbi:MAG: hypothetical protein ACM3IL_04360 [Deltaproteobacteria bacterium]
MMVKKYKILAAILILFMCFVLRVPDAFGVPQEFKKMNDLEKQEDKTKATTMGVPQVEYKADGLRDPFIWFQKKEGSGTEENQANARVPVEPPSLTIQGIVWGGNTPQAIINNKVLKVGDTIDEAKITSITRNGIEVLYKDTVFNINSPAAVQMDNIQKKAEGGQDEKK